MTNKDETAELIEALERIADPNKFDARNAPMPSKDARLALSWLSARPEFKAAREVLARLREGSGDCSRCPLDARDPDHDCAAPDCLDDRPLLNAETS